ncbi:hypothetical protein PRO82_000358 [Candidatus Protochlamydia amoebophila]|uniref:hypothetical protein n=1 Tax=Candidatus Protochlamydia amoebophila TaxID=362787 RepID=UPI001BC94C95|nr:hypothetical protein [Candidatus Protochlamydia amoebophila]MBS4163069.1 hypothetical protein [Candidatus Protochlamydia amoebophila]
MLNFNEAMHLAKHLFFDDIQQNEANQQFALKLTSEIKSQFKIEWEKDWKNDVFLGQFYSILWFYEERYACYKRAYDKLVDPPATLLLLLAGCYNGQDVLPITEEEFKSYLKKALGKKVTYEAALMMRNLCKLKGEPIQEKYWDQYYAKLVRESICAEPIVPNVLKDKNT